MHLKPPLDGEKTRGDVADAARTSEEQLSKGGEKSTHLPRLDFITGVITHNYRESSVFTKIEECRARRKEFARKRDKKIGRKVEIWRETKWSCHKDHDG